MFLMEYDYAQILYLSNHQNLLQECTHNIDDIHCFYASHFLSSFDPQQ